MCIKRIVILRSLSDGNLLYLNRDAKAREIVFTFDTQVLQECSQFIIFSSRCMHFLRHHHLLSIILALYDFLLVLHFLLRKAVFKVECLIENRVLLLLGMCSSAYSVAYRCSLAHIVDLLLVEYPKVFHFFSFDKLSVIL